MKKLFLINISILILLSALNAGKDVKYKCSRNYNGSYQGYVNVYANDKREAERKAIEHYKKKLRMGVDFAKCKPSMW